MGFNKKNSNKPRRIRKNYDAIMRLDYGQLFGVIKQNNGGSFTVLCSDSILRLGRLCNTMKRGPRISPGSFVVVTLRECESSNKHCDIIGYGDPPHNYRNMLIDKNAKTEIPDFEFETDNLFDEFEESNKTLGDSDDTIDWSTI